MSKPPIDLTETPVSSLNVYDGDLLHVRSDCARLPDGKLAVREYITHPGAVVIVPLLASGELVMERQHRYPLHRDFLSCLPGKSMVVKILYCVRSGSCWRKQGIQRKGGVTSLHCIPASVTPTKSSFIISRKNSPSKAQAWMTGNTWKCSPCHCPRPWNGSGRGKITDNKTVAGLFWAEKLLRGEW